MALEIFRLVGSVFVDTDEANKSLQKSDDKANKFGKTLLNGVETAAKWAAGLSVAAGAVTTLAVKSYAEYEQLAGGIETLFKDSANLVIQNAEAAYKTAGLNASDYMNTVTSFAASLLQSLGGDTVSAAAYADMAITDMSDNANKMGSSMESIQTAYQGFAKQNYTMLDNLKLGYGGTKTEMLRLLADADAINAKQGVITKYSIDNLSDVYEAIHVVQGELGIAGATALEATTTIEGGIKLIKAKLSDLFTKIGGAFAPVAQHLISVVIDNLPVIESMVERLLPIVASGADNIVGWLDKTIDRLSSLVVWVGENSDKIVEWTGYIIAAGVGIGTFLLYLNWGKIMAAAAASLEVVRMSVAKLNTTMKSNPIGFVISLITSLLAYIGYLYTTNEEFRAFVNEVLSVIWAKLKEVIGWIQTNIVPVLTVIMDWVDQNIAPAIDALVVWLGETIGAFWAWLTSSFQSTSDSAGGILQKIANFFKSAWGFIVSTWQACQPFFEGIWSGIVLPVWGLLQETAGAFLMAWDVIKLCWGYVEPYFSAIWSGIKATATIFCNFLSTGFKNAWEIIKLCWSVVSSYFSVIWQNIKGVFSVCAEFLGGYFRTAWIAIQSAWQSAISYFTMIWAGIKAVFAVVKGVLSGDFSDAWLAIENLWSKAKAFFSSVWTGIKNVFSACESWFGNTFKAAFSAVKNAFSAWGSFFGNLWTQIKDKFSAIGTNISNAIGSSVKSGLNGVISSIEGIINTGVNMINGAINLINDIPGVEIGKISKLSLPRLAKGGIVDDPTVAQIGEDGAEAVIPLERNTGWIDKLSGKVAQSIVVQGGQGDREQSLDKVLDKLDELLDALQANQTITLNKREFARIVKEVG